VETELNGETRGAKKVRISLPLIKSRQPGRLRLSNKIVNDLILS